MNDSRSSFASDAFPVFHARSPATRCLPLLGSRPTQKSRKDATCQVAGSGDFFAGELQGARVFREPGSRSPRIHRTQLHSSSASEPCSWDERGKTGNRRSSPEATRGGRGFPESPMERQERLPPSLAEERTPSNGPSPPSLWLRPDRVQKRAEADLADHPRKKRGGSSGREPDNPSRSAACAMAPDRSPSIGMILVDRRKMDLGSVWRTSQLIEGLSDCG